MSLILQIEDRPFARVEKVTQMQCDLCEARSFSKKEWLPADPSYDAELVTVKYERKGKHPSTETFDICPQCWTTKVVPWFISQGMFPRIED